MEGAWLEQPVRRHRHRIDVGRYLLVDADDERCPGAHSRGACAEGTIDVVAMIEAVADHAVHENDVEWLARLKVTLELAQIADDMGKATECGLLGGDIERREVLALERRRAALRVPVHADKKNAVIALFTRERRQDLHLEEPPIGRGVATTPPREVQHLVFCPTERIQARTLRESSRASQKLLARFPSDLEFFEESVPAEIRGSNFGQFFSPQRLSEEREGPSTKDRRFNALLQRVPSRRRGGR